MAKENSDIGSKTTRIGRLSRGEKWRFGIGCFLILAAGVLKLIAYHVPATVPYKPCFNPSALVLFILGIGFLISILELSEYIFDPESYKPNEKIEKLIKNLRLRAILFNNLSIVIFVFIILVIVTGFITLINPPLLESKPGSDLPVELTVRISSVVLLIFLVQILFRVFKYLLRVAAFYNAKADALEFGEIKQLSDPEKLMNLFTPDQYDMSDVPPPTFFDTLKGKG